MSTGPQHSVALPQHENKMFPTTIVPPQPLNPLGLGGIKARLSLVKWETISCSNLFRVRVANGVRLVQDDAAPLHP